MSTLLASPPTISEGEVVRRQGDNNKKEREEDGAQPSEHSHPIDYMNAFSSLSDQQKYFIAAELVLDICPVILLKVLAKRWDMLYLIGDAVPFMNMPDDNILSILTRGGVRQCLYS